MDFNKKNSSLHSINLNLVYFILIYSMIFFFSIYISLPKFQLTHIDFFLLPVFTIFIVDLYSLSITEVQGRIQFFLFFFILLILLYNTIYNANYFFYYLQNYLVIALLFVLPLSRFAGGGIPPSSIDEDEDKKIFRSILNDLEYIRPPN